MIELVIAAILQISTITTDVATQPSAQATAAPVTTTTTTDGGTGNWDDNQ